MRRKVGQEEIDYTKVSDQTLKEVLNHAYTEMYYVTDTCYFEPDYRRWRRKYNAIIQEQNRRRGLEP